MPSDDDGTRVQTVETAVDLIEAIQSMDGAG